MNKLTMSMAVVAACLIGSAWGQAKPDMTDRNDDSGRPVEKVPIIVLDFVCADKDRGEDFAHRIRLGLKRYVTEECEVIDKFTIREGSGPLKPDAKRADLEELLTEVFDGRVLVFGTLEHEKKGMHKEATYKWNVKVRVVDLRDKSPLDEWTESFSDTTERGAGVIASKIVEKVSGQARWIPPQHGDVPEPKVYGDPINPNSDFAAGGKGWIPIDNVSTIMGRDPERGNVLRMLNGFHREDWRDYRRKLMFGQANPARPPRIRPDESMGGVAGLEGCDIISEYFKPRDGWRYWLVVEGKGHCATKVFVKGWVKTEFAEDGLSETALIEHKLTPLQFSKLPPAERKRLIEADKRKNPSRYVREAWRWHISAGGVGDWTRWAGTFPPRGGLPKLDYLHVKILTYWPPGENQFSSVSVYEDPGQTKPLEEEKARTPGRKLATELKE
ncbi:MAG: hypothetical protein FWE88_01490 [Phycisphaerae bacterium]|nr:hypothetical protein [Phycisphaerae bacterium]